MNKNPLFKLADPLYDLLAKVSNHLQSPLLLAVRLVWGLQLMQAGWGKLTNIEKPIDYFMSLHIIFPVENAWVVAFTEFFGGFSSPSGC